MMKSIIKKRVIVYKSQDQLYLMIGFERTPCSPMEAYAKPSEISEKNFYHTLLFGSHIFAEACV